MANEFIARKGLIALSDSQITGSLDITGSLSITGISDVSASIAAAGGGGSDFPYTGSAIISGSLEVIGKVTGSVLIEGSGSTLFEVVGSEGQLFSITDSLSGSLFAVSDISGLPVLEAFSDNTVKIGTFNNEGLIVGGTNVTASNLLASDVTISHTPSSSPTSLVIGNPPHLVHTIEIASGSTNVMRFASNTGNGGQHTIGFSGHTGANSMQTAIIGQADGASGRVDLYFALTSGDNVTATTSDAVLRLDHNDVNFYQKVHANDDTFEIGGSNTGDSILYLGAEKRTGIARDYRGAGNASDFVVITMGSLGGTSVPTTHTRLRVTKEGDTEISGSLTASQNVDIQGTLSLPGFSDVSASLAAGDNLGNHTATQNLDMGTYAITNVGNVDGVDVSTLKSDFDTLKGKNVISGSSQLATEISGAFTAGNGISLSNGEFSVGAGTGLSQGGTGLSFDADGGTLTTNNADVDHILINDGGIFKRIAKSNINVGDFNNDAGYLTSSPFTAAGISGSFTSTSSSIATDISNLERLSKGRITFLYTGSVTYAPPGYIAFLDQVTDNIIINTSSYNGVDLDASVNSDYSKFQFNEVGSLITVRKVSDGSFKTYKVSTVTTNYTGNADNVGYLVDGGSFITVMESGSISDGDEVEFIWDKSAGVGGAYGPTAGTLTKTFAGIYQPGYNYLDMFFGTATDTEYDGSPENLSGVTVSSSFTAPSSYFLPAISQSESLTLGGLTVNGTITGTTITGTTTLFDTGSSTLSSNGGSLGDIVKFGGSTTIAGGLYYLNSSGGWTLAQANIGGKSTGSLAVALGTNSTTDGMLLRGFVNPFALADAEIGAPVYISSASAGRFSGLLSQQTGEIVRVVGHAYGSDLIYFNPSNNWIEL